MSTLDPEGRLRLAALQERSGHDRFQEVGPTTGTDTETGLGTFFLHRDYRDYYANRGVTGYGRLYVGRNASLTGSATATSSNPVWRCWHRATCTWASSAPRSRSSTDEGSGSGFSFSRSRMSSAKWPGNVN